MVETEDIPNIIRKMRAAWPVSEKSLGELAAALSLCHFPKRHCLVSEGVAGGLAYFLEKGMTRSYWVVDGEEITTSFSTEGTLVFSMDEFYYRRPSEEYVETIEPVEAYAISVDTLRTLMTTRQDLTNWSRIIHQNEYRRLHQSHKERLTLPARERYEAFARQFPEVCQRARLADIASYLGITQSTLSRIRAGR